MITGYFAGVGLSGLVADAGVWNVPQITGANQLFARNRKQEEQPGAAFRCDGRGRIIKTRVFQQV